MNEVKITVSGRVGSGKSALCGEIEILCKALGLEVEWQGGQQEKNLAHADWTEALEMYKPRVTIVEQVAPSVADAAGASEDDARDAKRWRMIKRQWAWIDTELVDAAIAKESGND